MIWLIGNKGMLGTELSLLFEKYGYNFIGSDCEVDIIDIEAIQSFAKNKSFKWIINCAAYTQVDKAEDDIEVCRRINTLGASNIAIYAKSIDAGLIHISTDYVFDGKETENKKPYSEDDETNPISVYGLSKRDGELEILKNNDKSIIIRTAWLYGKYGNNFVKTMIRLMNQKDELKVVNDQIGTPTYANDLANIIIKIIEKVETGNKIPFGIYHYTNDGEISWFDFAKEIYRLGRENGLISKDCLILHCTSTEFSAKVKRPAYSVLDKTKIKTALDITIPTWESSLKRYLNEN